MMKTLPIVLASLAALAACGGKSKGDAAPPAPPASNGSPSGFVDDPSTPFDDVAVQAALAATPGVEACGVDASSTMGAHFAAQRDGLIHGGGETTPVDDSFKCVAMGDKWQCDWAVFTKSSGEADPCDPCAGEGGSGYIIMAEVGADGAIVPSAIQCNAPG